MKAINSKALQMQKNSKKETFFEGANEYTISILCKKEIKYDQTNIDGTAPAYNLCKNY